ncbi:hypothetical protein T03_11302 [Trichinella britovi]|uniref:Uncharacterized protein n=1 Tax=Trichinella britovi TaxID=45882 RepID=A0A0V1CUS1_TRIBR|nr:hypothetical protein T03_11302 [Trichinella britovi]
MVTRDSVETAIRNDSCKVLQRRSHSSVATVSQQWTTGCWTAPGFALRLRPRANKNLHIPSGYASGVLLHHICPQGYASGYASGNFSKISKFLKYSRRLRPRAMKNLHITLRA